MSLRYGAVKGRMEDVALELMGYADRMLPVIEELEEEVLPAARRGGSQTFRALTDPKY